MLARWTLATETCEFEPALINGRQHFATTSFTMLWYHASESAGPIVFTIKMQFDSCTADHVPRTSGMCMASSNICMSRSLCTGGAGVRVGKEMSPLSFSFLYQLSRNLWHVLCSTFTSFTFSLFFSGIFDIPWHSSFWTNSDIFLIIRLIIWLFIILRFWCRMRVFRLQLF